MQDVFEVVIRKRLRIVLILKRNIFFYHLVPSKATKPVIKRGYWENVRSKEDEKV